MRYYFLALGTLLLVCIGCSFDGQQVFKKDVYHAPPASMVARPGPMVDGPGPGVMMPLAPAAPRAFATKTTQVRFVAPEGMQVGWQIPGGFAVKQVPVPGRYDFPQGATYRLKLENIPGREGLVIYPTLEVYPAHPATDAYLAHNTVPIELTDEDLDQVESNNFVTKVIYLPDPKFQELAIAGVETLVSTRLDPGVDPVAEAERRGTIMVVLRMGNMDLEMPPAKGDAAGTQDASTGSPSAIQPVAYQQVSGEDGKHVPPMPIGTVAGAVHGVPGPMIVGGSGMPGQPAPYPVAGMGNVPSWGMVATGTPIGLQGPPHLPYGRAAGLKSHTVRNRTNQRLPKPTEHLLIDVKHKPGLSLPKPVKHVRYTESHPVYRPGELAYPAWSLGGPQAPQPAQP